MLVLGCTKSVYPEYLFITIGDYLCNTCIFLAWSWPELPYTHTRWNRLLFANRQRGIFNLHVGCANTQETSAILSPDPQGLCGQPKHEVCHRTQDSNPRPTGLEASVLTPKPSCIMILWHVATILDSGCDYSTRYEQPTVLPEIH